MFTGGCEPWKISLLLRKYEILLVIFFPKEFKDIE